MGQSHPLRSSNKSNVLDIEPRFNLKIFNYNMAESKPELVSCTFDPADKPTLREEAIPQVIKCTFDVPKTEEQEKEKVTEEEKNKKDDKASDQKDEKSEE